MMEKDFISGNSLMDLEFISKQKVETHYHQNFELVYILNGTMDIVIENENYRLSKNDVIVVNNNRKHSYSGSENLFFARFLISAKKVYEMIQDDWILFVCNSTVENTDLYDELRKILNHILNQSLSKEKNGNIHEISLHYQLLSQIVKNFLFKSDRHAKSLDHKQSDPRMDEIFQYIRINYSKKISLQDVADHFHLSHTYLSRFIPQKCGLTFSELLNSVRLQHTMEALMYSKDSIMVVALDNGFASVGAYNKVFKDAHGLPPSQFRKEFLESRKKNQNSQQEQENKVATQQKIVNYLSENKLQITGQEKNRLQLAIDVQKFESSVWEKKFTKSINMGRAIDLTKSTFQKHTLLLKNDLKAKYIRFWDIYNPELLLDINAPINELNFSGIDTVIEFLLENQLRPYMVFGFKPYRVLKNINSPVVEIEKNEQFKSKEHMEDFFEAFVKHLIKRYGVEEVETWYFELWRREEVTFTKKGFNYRKQRDEDLRRYFIEFESVASILRKFLPNIKVGGSGFPVRYYGKAGFPHVLKMWLEFKELPDFIAITSFPYNLEKESDVYHERKNIDIDFVRQNLEIVHNSMKECSFPPTFIHVSEYGASLSSRSVLNDSYANGAFLICNAFLTFEYARLFCHFHATDLYSNFTDSQQFLFGGAGILSKSSGLKPSFYAMNYLNLLHEKIHKKGDKFIFTGNEKDSFKLLCHNYKKLNFDYYMMNENTVDARHLSDFFEDKQALIVEVKIENVENGDYMIRHEYVNQLSGSLQDEWLALNGGNEIEIFEEQYLKRIAIPKLIIDYIAVTDNTLSFTFSLEPNEFRYLHILQQS